MPRETTPNPDRPGTAMKEAATAVKRQSREVAQSATEIRQSTERIEDSADRSTVLAADRTMLAAERTYAAWVRTGLFALASGIGARALLTGLLPEWLILADASALIAFSVFCFGAAVWRHLNPGPPPPAPDVRRIPPMLLIGLNAFLALVSIAALIGLWTVSR